MHLRSVAGTISRLLLSPRCPLCGSVVAGDVFCDACAHQLAYNAAASCPICAIAHVGGEICAQCLKDPPAFAGTVAAGAYAYPMDRLIMRLKYGGDLTLVAALANLLADAIGPESLPDLVVPVPLAPSRLRQRGFNQALEICKPIARRFGLRLRTDLLRRSREGPAQAALALAERAGNVRNAFRSAEVAGLDVAVVDDVMTSGATLREVAACLRAAGAGNIHCWVLARTPVVTGHASRR